METFYNKTQKLIDKVNNELDLETYELTQQKKLNIPNDEIAYTEGLVATLRWTVLELKNLLNWIQEKNELEKACVERKGSIEH